MNYNKGFTLFCFIRLQLCSVWNNENESLYGKKRQTIKGQGLFFHVHKKNFEIVLLVLN